MSSWDRSVTCSGLSTSTVVAPRRPRTMRGADMAAHSTGGFGSHLGGAGGRCVPHTLFICAAQFAHDPGAYCGHATAGELERVERLLRCLGGPRRPADTAGGRRLPLHAPTARPDRGGRDRPVRAAGAPAGRVDRERAGSSVGAAGASRQGGADAGRVRRPRLPPDRGRPRLQQARLRRPAPRSDGPAPRARPDSATPSSSRGSSIRRRWSPVSRAMWSTRTTGPSRTCSPPGSRSAPSLCRWEGWPSSRAANGPAVCGTGHSTGSSGAG